MPLFLEREVMFMSTYNAKNYTEQGGEKTVIGGTLVVEAGATVTGITGIAAVSANQATSTAATIADLKTDFNALLVKLKAAGLMTAD